MDSGISKRKVSCIELVNRTFGLMRTDSDQTLSVTMLSLTEGTILNYECRTSSRLRTTMVAFERNRADKGRESLRNQNGTDTIQCKRKGMPLASSQTY